MGWRNTGDFLGTPHQRPELTFDIVVHKELFRQRRLVIKHVNQKAQRTQIVTQLVESTGRTGTLLIDFSFQHLLNSVTHAQDRLRGLVQTQHRQHAAHLRELARHIGEHNFVLRVAKKNIQ